MADRSVLNVLLPGIVGFVRVAPAPAVLEGVTGLDKCEAHFFGEFLDPFGSIQVSVGDDVDVISVWEFLATGHITRKTLDYGVGCVEEEGSKALAPDVLGDTLEAQIEEIRLEVAKNDPNDLVCFGFLLLRERNYEAGELKV